VSTREWAPLSVVPFIPIEGVTMDDCVALARGTGAEVAKRFQHPGVPVRRGVDQSGAEES
jgi:glutamate formiminotransferase